MTFERDHAMVSRAFAACAKPQDAVFDQIFDFLTIQSDLCLTAAFLSTVIYIWYEGGGHKPP